MSTGDAVQDPALVATYRLQLHAGFTFGDAEALVPYLARLGVSHLYLSPILQAAPGSSHGYDQCDPTRISQELGGETGFRRLVAEARKHHLGIVLDIVPNHMATHETNPWWWELLRSGPAGRAGGYFDVEWHPGDPDLDGRVMLPVLGDSPERTLAAAELRIVERGDERVLRYYDQHFPLGDDPGGSTVDAALLSRQHYLLAQWREASQRLNYRRFFDISTLVALREEDPAVFAAVHDLPLRMVEEGQVQGLRVDHVDGLRDPQGYLEALRRRAPGAWLVVEKILEPGEHLPGTWPVAGTTGYDFIHRLQGVFVDPAAEESLTRAYATFTGEPTDYREVIHDTKLKAARELFGSDLARLDRIFARVCAGAGVRVTAEARLRVLEEVAVCLPVYRAYARPGSAVATDSRAQVEAAVGGARRRLTGVDNATMDLLRGVLLLEVEGEDAAELAARFQQLSGPLMAKGVEDTAFYRYNRFVALNEVGDDPGTFGVSVAEFHAANAAALERHPATMLASSTHDTKRSEDVRARLSLLSQVPDGWATAVERWSGHNARHRRGDQPDRNIEYLVYQTMVGAWPLPRERAVAYAEKAAREARQHTSWTDPDADYEQALRDFTAAVSDDPEFQADLRSFVEPLVMPGRVVALAMALIKLTSPGIPDIYQGSEAWDLSLVDPDNRRPVDYGMRAELLERPGGTTARLDDAGQAKLHVTVRALAARRNCPGAFGVGSTYTPLEAVGPGAGGVLAYARGTAGDPLKVVVAVPRLVLAASPEWHDLRLELGDGEWTSRLTGAPVRGPRPTLAEVFEGFPVGLLERVG